MAVEKTTTTGIIQSRKLTFDRSVPFIRLQPPKVARRLRSALQGRCQPEPQDVKKCAGPGERESKITIAHLAEWTGGSAIRGFTAALLRIAVAGQNLRCACDAAAEGFVEGDAAQAPMVRLALPFQPPFGGPSEILVAPDEVADQGDLAARFGDCSSER